MRVLALTIFGSLCAWGQQPKFLAADVHPSAPRRNPQMRGGYISGGQYQIRTANMVDLISTAYGVDAEQVAGGPSWMEWNHYDIRAVAPPNTSAANTDKMLQALLADRFKLVVHRDTRPLTAYVLSQGKGKPKLKAAEGKGTPGCQPVPSPPPSPDSIPMNLVECRNVSMPAFASLLRSLANGYIANPVLDQTGINGNWDFDVKWTPSGLRGVAGSDAVTIFDAIDRQLGLKLEEGKVPAPAIVVDSVNEKPTPNPADTAKLLPPPPPLEFEVADLRPSRSDSTPQPFGLRPGGRYEMHSVPLWLLILIGWNLTPAQDLDAVGAPKWLDRDLPDYDLVAKINSYSGGSRYFPQVDDEDLGAMLRSLLEERFKMKAHFEDRIKDAYTLVADKPKMKRADPAERTNCKSERLSPPSPGQGPPPLRIICRNITMTQFAGQLAQMAGLYFRYPVENATGLEGGYDFTLTYNTQNPNNAGGGRGGGRGGGKSGPAPAQAGDGASDPMGGVSLYEAIQKQLGLKVEQRKRPEPVFVIDHIEEKPVEN